MWGMTTSSALGISPEPWRFQGAVTDPGAMAALVADMPADLAGVRRVSQELVEHNTRATDGAFVLVRGKRRSEVDFRYADAMLGRLRELGA